MSWVRVRRKEAGMHYYDKVKHIVGASLGVQIAHLGPDAALLGSVPELDSLAVVGVIAALGDHFGIAVEDEDICASHFATVRSLAEFVQEKLDT